MRSANRARPTGRLGEGKRGAMGAAAANGSASRAQTAPDPADRSAPCSRPLPALANPSLIGFCEGAHGEAVWLDPADHPEYRVERKPQFEIRSGAVDPAAKETP